MPLAQAVVLRAGFFGEQQRAAGAQGLAQADEQRVARFRRDEL